MNLHKCIFVNSDCYKACKTIKPKGVMWHSTGADNPNLKRYVQPDDGKLGYNKNQNHWNRPGLDVCVHAFIGKLQDGTIATYQTLPWDRRGWHCYKGSKGSGNNTHISFEICEDSRADPVYFAAVYKEAVELTAYLCKLHGLSPLEDGVMIDHAEGYARGIASNHGDVGHWLKLHGKSMDDARLDVAYYMEHGCHKGEEENGMRYKCLRDVPKAYRDETIDRLVALGIIKGKGGIGENMIIDLGEDAIRILIYNDRAGLYPKK